MQRMVETRRDRRALAADAGFGQVSVASLLAGVLVAYGAFAILAGLVAGIIDAADADITLVGDWEDIGTAGGLIAGAVLFLSYLFGGYVAGRMARRAGVLHGVLLFLLGILIVAVVAVVIRQIAGTDAIADNLRDLGIPTSGSEWGDAATVAGIASLAGILLGSVLGGMLGERWHAKLLTRAADPNVGAEAAARKAAAEQATRADEIHTGSMDRVRVASPTGWRRTQRGEETDAERQARWRAERGNVGDRTIAGDADAPDATAPNGTDAAGTRPTGRTDAGER